MFLWLLWVSSMQYFPPPYLFCHPTLAFPFPFWSPSSQWQIAAIHPVLNSLFALSLPLQLWHICSQIHLMIFPKVLWPCLAFSTAGEPVHGLLQPQDSCHHLWLDSEPLKTSRNPQLQLQYKPYFYHFSSFKVLLNDSQNQVEMQQHQYCPQWANNSVYYW